MKSVIQGGNLGGLLHTYVQGYDTAEDTLTIHYPSERDCT